MESDIMYLRAHNGHAFGCGAEWSPPMDVVETETSYRVRIEAPGAAREDLAVEYDNGVMTVSGEKKVAHLAENESLRHSERRGGSFSRSLRFKRADGDKIAATFKSGLLEITVPKTVDTAPLRIEVAPNAA